MVLEPMPNTYQGDTKNNTTLTDLLIKAVTKELEKRRSFLDGNSNDVRSIQLTVKLDKFRTMPRTILFQPLVESESRHRRNIDILD